MLEKEFQYFLDNKEKLLKQYKDFFVVIVGEKVVGNYSSQEEALKEASQKYALGSFLIQKVSEDKNDIVQNFYSRVYF